MPRAEITDDMFDKEPGSDLYDAGLTVIGIEDGGDIIFFDPGVVLQDKAVYTEGVNVAQFGLHNLRKEEVARLLALDGIPERDRRLLEKWTPELTKEQGYVIAKSQNYPEPYTV